MPINEGRIEVAVYFDTQNELDLAEKIMTEDDPSQNVRIYDGVVEGWISKSNRSVLRKHGLLIETLSSPSPTTESEAASPQERSMESVVTRDVGDKASSTGTVRESSRSSSRSASLAFELSPEANQTLKRQLDRFQDKAHSRAAEEIKSKVRRAKRRAPTRDATRSTRSKTHSMSEFDTDASSDASSLADSPVVTRGAARTALSLDPELTEDVYEVRLAGPMRPEWHSSLTVKGFEICSFAPPNSYRMFLTDPQVGVVRSLPFVESIDRYSLGETVTADFLQALESAEQTSSAMNDPTAAVPAEMFSSMDSSPTPPQIFEVVCHRPKDLQKIIHLIVEEGGEILDTSQDTIRFKAPIESSLLAALADLSEVKKLAPYTPPTLFSNFCRTLIGIDAVAENGTQHYTGAGEVVGVFDSGIDLNHPDFVGRVKEAISFRSASYIDQVGHGTHVAGIIAGTGAASEDDRICGVAPGAELVVIGIVKADNSLELPVDLGDLLREAVIRGAKIINLSWGTPIGGAYDQGSASVDKFIYENPDVLVVVAAGNSGTAPKGLPMFKSIGTPATAKNVLTVGASATSRTGIIKNTWGKLRPKLFKQPPMSDLATAGNPDLPAAISSRRRQLTSTA